MGSDNCVSSCFVKVLLGTFAVVGFILVLLVATVDLTTATDQVQGGRIGSSKTTPTTSSATSDQFAGTSTKHADQKLVHPELDLNYMSKRRVPNGPDPIHNRRTGNSGRPPGQS
ncbi:PREDICTED: CLAVATA3/ESR (CLE)-related protein 25 [Fragaria vesca subsp. vesca]|uniref:CLAVATA3/ESR (CLE)-related protein 25 n=1 Tax=Fragaria vesca subsp. vesca TaxID=101020 RepID=UPI0002C2EB28|nr:PREDICTED: CLAVATA3/ESR (CLE)-related protein 25 [Fragaria vesca subsp. vesca]